MAQDIATSLTRQLQTYRYQVLAAPTMLDADMLTPSRVAEILAYEDFQGREIIGNYRDTILNFILKDRGRKEKYVLCPYNSAVRKRHNAVYSISPLALLLQTPTTPIFSERELNASIAPDLIADVSSSRRYAVELGLLERHADVYRLSGMGTAVHWVETSLQEGLRRFAAIGVGQVIAMPLWLQPDAGLDDNREHAQSLRGR